jgi:hypothetical protein
MRKLLTKKSAILGMVIAVVAATAAYAYLSSTGTGTGSGTTDAAAPALTLTGTLDAPLENIGDEQQMTIKAANPGDSPTKVTDIAVGAITLPDDCPTGSFTFADPTTTGTEVAAGATDTVVGYVDVTFANVDDVQDTCTTFSVALTSE